MPLDDERCDDALDDESIDDSKPVYSAIVGNNSDLIPRVCRLYARPGDRIADVTYGKGVFWRRVDLARYRFAASDMMTCPNAPYDFRHLPYPDGSHDIVVLDPPYAHDPQRELAARIRMRRRPVR